MKAHERKAGRNLGTTFVGYHTTSSLCLQGPTPFRRPGIHYCSVQVAQLAACTSSLASRRTSLQEREAGASNTNSLETGPSAEPGAPGLCGSSPARVVSTHRPRQPSSRNLARTCTASTSAAAARILLSRRSHSSMRAKEKA